MPSVDPLASLQVRAAVVTIGGSDFVVSGQPASEWIVKVLGNELHHILPAWLEDPDDQLDVIDMLVDGRTTDLELHEVTLELMTVAAGRSWWWAMRLIQMAGSDNSVWATLNGRLILAGIRAPDVPLAAWIDGLYACMVDNMDGEKRQEFDAQIDTPPVTEGIDEQEESQAFLNLMGSMMDEG